MSGAKVTWHCKSPFRFSFFFIFLKNKKGFSALSSSVHDKYAYKMVRSFGEAKIIFFPRVFVCLWDFRWRGIGNARRYIKLPKEIYNNQTCDNFVFSTYSDTKLLSEIYTLERWRFRLLVVKRYIITKHVIIFFFFFFLKIIIFNHFKILISKINFKK